MESVRCLPVRLDLRRSLRRIPGSRFLAAFVRLLKFSRASWLSGDIAVSVDPGGAVWHDFMQSWIKGAPLSVCECLFCGLGRLCGGRSGFLRLCGLFRLPLDHVRVDL